MTSEHLPKAVWYSRHQPTDTQVIEIESKGYRIVDASNLASAVLETPEAVISTLFALRDMNAGAIFGVFSAPLLAGFLRNAGVISCYSAWNTARAKEGEAPIFEHLRFVKVASFGAKGRIHFS